jgi:hypothetical protein
VIRHRLGAALTNACTSILSKRGRPLCGRGRCARRAALHLTDVRHCYDLAGKYDYAVLAAARADYRLAGRSEER